MNVQVKTRLCQTIAGAGVPVDTLTIVGQSATATFMPWASAEEVQRGLSLIASFDWSDAAQQAWEDALDPKKGSLRQQAAGAVDQIDQFLAVADTATAAQVRAAVKGLAQVTRAIILRVGEL